MTALRTLDLLVIAIYFAVVAGIGLRFARRQNSTETYFVARRSIPSWAMGLSMFATIISSITFIAYPGAAYAGNWNELVPGFMVLGVLLLVGTVIIPFFRHAVGMSAYEYFEKRFGYGARAYSSLAFIALAFFQNGFRAVYLLALTITGMTGWNIYRVILLSGLVTIFYTLFGGLEAVIWTEVIARHRQRRRRAGHHRRAALDHARRRGRGVSSGGGTKQIQPRRLAISI